ncbi:hypothetical protein V8E52_007878 [Russula decolorans]
MLHLHWRKVIILVPCSQACTATFTAKQSLSLGQRERTSQPSHVRLKSQSGTNGTTVILQHHWCHMFCTGLYYPYPLRQSRLQGQMLVIR